LGNLPFVLRRCPLCEFRGLVRVIDTRHSVKLEATFRTHSCPRCGAVTSTIERVLKVKKAVKYIRRKPRKVASP